MRQIKKYQFVNIATLTANLTLPDSDHIQFKFKAEVKMYEILSKYISLDTEFINFI